MQGCHHNARRAKEHGPAIDLIAGFARPIALKLCPGRPNWGAVASQPLLPPVLRKAATSALRCLNLKSEISNLKFCP